MKAKNSRSCARVWFGLVRRRGATFASRRRGQISRGATARHEQQQLKPTQSVKDEQPTRKAPRTWRDARGSQSDGAGVKFDRRRANQANVLKKQHQLGDWRACRLMICAHVKHWAKRRAFGEQNRTKQNKTSQVEFCLLVLNLLCLRTILPMRTEQKLLFAIAKSNNWQPSQANNKQVARLF